MLIIRSQVLSSHVTVLFLHLPKKGKGVGRRKQERKKRGGEVGNKREFAIAMAYSYIVCATFVWKVWLAQLAGRWY